MNGEYYINTFNCEAIYNRIAFASSDMNLIFEYSLDKDKIILVSPPNEDIFTVGLYGNIVTYENSLFLIPFNAKNMWKLCNDNTWEKLPSPGSEHRGKFLGAIPIDKYIYLLGYGCKEIYKFNVLTYQITKLSIDMKLELLVPDDTGFLGHDYEIVEGRIFVPVMCANKILEINPVTDLISVIDVPSRSNGYSGIIYDESGFWLAPRKGRYFVHYLLSGKVEEYELPKEYKNSEMYFGSAYREGDHIIFTAFFGKNFKFKIKSPYKYEVFGPSIYYCKMLNNKGKVIHERNGRTHYIDVNSNIRKLNLSIQNTTRLEYIGKYVNRKKFITEGDDLSLNEYLKIVEYCSL